jgi:hypothetical protein
MISLFLNIKAVRLINQLKGNTDYQLIIFNLFFFIYRSETETESDEDINIRFIL